MAERGDMVVLHEPFCNLRDYGETDAGGRTFGSPLLLLAWLRSETQGLRVFLADHALTGELFQDVLADRRFLAGTPACIPHPPSRGDRSAQLRAAPRPEHQCDRAGEAVRAAGRRPRGRG
jgi:hypothetical protein